MGSGLLQVFLNLECPLTVQVEVLWWQPTIVTIWSGWLGGRTIHDTMVRPIYPPTPLTVGTLVTVYWETECKKILDSRSSTLSERELHLTWKWLQGPTGTTVWALASVPSWWLAWSKTPANSPRQRRVIVHRLPASQKEDSEQQHWITNKTAVTYGSCHKAIWWVKFMKKL